MPENSDSPQDRIDHAKDIRARRLRKRNMQTLAHLLAKEYGLRVVSVYEDQFTLRRPA